MVQTLNDVPFVKTTVNNRFCPGYRAISELEHYSFLAHKKVPPPRHIFAIDAIAQPDSFNPNRKIPIGKCHIDVLDILYFNNSLFIRCF